MLRALRIQLLLVGLMLASWHSPGACAADAESGRACAEIQSDAQRLACYDRFFRPPAPAEQVKLSSTAPAPAPVTVAGPGETERRDFGLSEADKRRSVNLPPAPDSISVTIQSIGRRPTGERVFRTNDGQVWVEVEPSPRLRVDPGETVTIRKGAIGSYMLITPKRVGTKVRRVN